MGFLPARLRGSRTICSEYETRKAQYAYRCVALPDVCREYTHSPARPRLNAPAAGAWCSLTSSGTSRLWRAVTSQCTYRCVVLPDREMKFFIRLFAESLNAPTGAWCSLTWPTLSLTLSTTRLNAPTGAWCSLTVGGTRFVAQTSRSQCTYRCVVLPDSRRNHGCILYYSVSMHLQVRGAP